MDRKGRKKNKTLSRGLVNALPTVMLEAIARSVSYEQRKLNTWVTVRKISRTSNNGISLQLAKHRSNVAVQVGYGDSLSPIALTEIITAVVSGIQGSASLILRSVKPS